MCEHVRVRICLNTYMCVWSPRLTNRLTTNDLFNRKIMDYVLCEEITLNTATAPKNCLPGATALQYHHRQILPQGKPTSSGQSASSQ